MKADTAQRLAERACRVSDELNEMAREIEANEPDAEAVRLRQGIGRVMWAVYYEILKPTFEEHPSLEPESATKDGPTTMIQPTRSAARSRDLPAQRSARGSSRPRRPRRSGR